MRRNWSISLEHGEYEEDIELLVKDAINAVEQTKKGYYVNVVTPAVFDHPGHYLTEALVLYFGSSIHINYIDQCGCGGHVLRVWKKESSN
ncbi:CGCGG family rSAM-modified RiPP protein [Bacillus sp. DTU_2020_1000418_1_SI_GHA_SEK_038]|uniref:CGCGG family putative rSAM-modified RiPP protein n=1 Tax=Bacillus sp. DTU_2020_1000418_1_SI_GHA_SEK_038 TaxID=3077585 RepID=UPI0028EDBFA4|nr:CGCGG family rSAM-modified RiPP protein [Bacillus sp. DTU_2020_1000418_1_SI_GHA_SEK_038]WNS73572.1 CGCGG family rSAM-modified RiPP protein [Bacillus sp. DTU_2020_1000418_1_SI_GHA_SEK_038]